MRHPKACSQIRTSFAWILVPTVLIAAAASCDRQAPGGLDDAGLDPLFQGKPPPAVITVDDFNPKEGAQGNMFPMTVYGGGFGKGAKVVFVLRGEDVSTIETTTISVDETTLTADVSISLDTEVSTDYQVAVELRGSRGVGTEKLFEVTEKPPWYRGTTPLDVLFRDDPLDRVTSDGNGLFDCDRDGSPDVECYSDWEDPDADGNPDVDAIFSELGYFKLTENDPRRYSVDLSDPITSGPDWHPDRLPSFMQFGPTHNVAGMITTLHHSNGGGFLGMTEPTATVRLVTQWWDYKYWEEPDPRRGYDYATPEHYFYVLRFGSACGDDTPNQDRVQIIADFAGDVPVLWTVEAFPDPVEGNAWLCRRNQHKGKHTTETVGRFNVPLKFEIRLQ